MWRWVVHQDLPLSLALFITVVNLQEVADPKPDPNPDPKNLPCNYTEAYRSLWVGYTWTTEPLFFTLAVIECIIKLFVSSISILLVNWPRDLYTFNFQAVGF